jgi:mono/diheme cytochrome c family protein
MPAFGSALNEREIKAILDYIKFTWPEDIRETQSQRSKAVAGN